MDKTLISNRKACQRSPIRAKSFVSLQSRLAQPYQCISIQQGFSREIYLLTSQSMIVSPMAKDSGVDARVLICPFATHAFIAYMWLKKAFEKMMGSFDETRGNKR